RMPYKHGRENSMVDTHKRLLYPQHMNLSLFGSGVNPASVPYAVTNVTHFQIDDETFRLVT
ncbi:MAG TPA: hypothetical protein VMX16_09160, partial [Terriglobia bacterium]|nr:hypothetical protein [Terriglobia bacterium]